MVGLLDYSKDRIAGIESGARYDALGPVTKSGDRAYGKYQVMGSNVGPWTRQYYGRELTPQEFASDPAAQEAVFEGKFGSYIDKYGPAGAARAWFAGEGGMNDPNRRDALGTSVADYERMFLGGGGGGGMAQPMLLGPTGSAGEEPAANPVKGFFDDVLNDPMFQMGMGLLSASGPSLMPVSTGQAIAMGAEQAQRGQQVAMQNQAKRAQLEEMTRQQKAQDRLREQYAGTPMGILAEAAPEQFVSGLLQSQFPKPSSFERKASAVQGLLGRELTPDEVLKMAGGGTTINMGENLNTPIPIAQTGNVRMPDGSPVPIGTTYQQALDAGATYATSADQQKAGQKEMAGSVLTQMDDLLFGDKENPGILEGAESGIIPRIQKGIETTSNYYSQNDPRVAQYQGLVAGTLAPLIKSFGESGALSDADRAAAVESVPQVVGLPDTEKVAKGKLKQLRGILGDALVKAEKEGKDVTQLRDQYEQLFGQAPGGTTLSPIRSQRSNSTADPLGIR